MNLPTIESLDLKGKRVLLRLDLDVTLEGGKVLDDTRLRVSIPTIRYLFKKDCRQILILGHRGRPQGRVVESLKMAPVGKHLWQLLEEELGEEKVQTANLVLLENLRFNPGEEANDHVFAENLAKKGEIYINESFADSHRKHASIVSLPALLPHAAGFHLAKEVRVLSEILGNPKKPVVIVLGGGKLDKADLAEKLLDHADWVLAGGVLPKKVTSYCRTKNGRICLAAARLLGEAEDITPDSAQEFSKIIETAGTVVWNGPMGDIAKGFWEGTKAVAFSFAKSQAFKVVGGADTVFALKKLGLIDKMDWVSTGGGAMLEFLADGDLPGLAALRQ